MWVMSNVEAVGGRAIRTLLSSLARAIRHGRPSRRGEQLSLAGQCHRTSGQPHQLVPHCRRQSPRAIPRGCPG